MRGRAIVTRGASVHLPAPLAVLPTYPTLADLEVQFLASLRFKSPMTVKTYGEGLHQWAAFLAAAGVNPFESTAEVLPDDVLEYFLGWLADAGYSRATTDTYLSATKALWRFATARRLVPPRFTYDAMRGGVQLLMGRRHYRSPRIDPRLPLVVIHADELPLPDWSDRQGASRLEVLRDRALLHVLFYSGARRSEVAGLNRSDVQDGYAAETLITGKGGRERHLYFGDDAQQAIRAYLDARSDDLVPLFLRHDNRRGRPGPGGERWRLSQQSVWGVVKRHAAAVGVQASTHHLRHFKASTLLNRGASLSEVQDVLGHADPSTTKRVYAHYTPEVLRRTVERYSAAPWQLVGELGGR